MGISPEITGHAERIVSESLTNIAHHVQANNVWLDVVQSVESLTIAVWDDYFDWHLVVHFLASTE